MVLLLEGLSFDNIRFVHAPSRRPSEVSGTNPRRDSMHPHFFPYSITHSAAVVDHIYGVHVSVLSHKTSALVTPLSNLEQNILLLICVESPSPIALLFLTSLLPQKRSLG